MGGKINVKDLLLNVWKIKYNFLYLGILINKTIKVMTSQDFQYLKDTEQKALKVIDSCETKQQARNAKRYVRLLQNRYGDRFGFAALFKLDPKAYHLCNDVTWKLANKVRMKLASLKSL